MKINIDAPITNLDGTQLKEGDKLLTLKDFITTSLLAESKEQTADDKIKRFSLAVKVFNGEKELSPEDVVLIKERIGEMYGALIVGKCYELLK